MSFSIVLLLAVGCLFAIRAGRIRRLCVCVGQRQGHPFGLPFCSLRHRATDVPMKVSVVLSFRCLTLRTTTVSFLGFEIFGAISNDTYRAEDRDRIEPFNRFVEIQ